MPLPRNPLLSRNKCGNLRGNRLRRPLGVKFSATEVKALSEPGRHTDGRRPASLHKQDGRQELGAAD